MKALSDVIVLDFTHMLAGPFGTMLLADMGARTIKIEPPGAGEQTRRLQENHPDYSLHGMGSYMLTLGRNKESVAIDLKNSKGRALLHRLVQHADVVMNNFSPGVPKRLGIDHASLAAINPRIITCSLTGFGETGPEPNRPAFDMVAQGWSGGMSITGEPGQPPVRPGLPFADLNAGMFAAIGILGALHARETTGRGQHVDISMLDSQISLLTYMATMALMSGRDPVQLGNAHFGHTPYDSFRTKTGYLILAVVTDQQWRSLVEVLDAAALDDPAFATPAGRLEARPFITEQVQARLATDTCEAWLARLKAASVPAGPVNGFLQALNDPQVRARNMVVRVEHPLGGSMEEPGNPVKLSDTYEDTFAPPPLVGQHTDAVLRDLLGLESAEIAELRKAGAIG
ncbi:MAG TPA: CoA transferase [Candidatus Cybelea sp.]|nr:CoA transferase [Candidatus Cybelea sp.]